MAKYGVKQEDGGKPKNEAAEADKKEAQALSKLYPDWVRPQDHNVFLMQRDFKGISAGKGKGYTTKALNLAYGSGGFSKKLIAYCDTVRKENWDEKLQVAIQDNFDLGMKNKNRNPRVAKALNSIMKDVAKAKAGVNLKPEAKTEVDLDDLPF